MKEENCMMMIERLIFTGGKFECGLTVKIWRGGTRLLWAGHLREVVRAGTGITV
jgi:hypothetical protein